MQPHPREGGCLWVPLGCKDLISPDVCHLLGWGRSSSETPASCSVTFRKSHATGTVKQSLGQAGSRGRHKVQGSLRVVVLAWWVPQAHKTHNTEPGRALSGNGRLWLMGTHGRGLTIIPWVPHCSVSVGGIRAHAGVRRGSTLSTQVFLEIIQPIH